MDYNMEGVISYIRDTIKDVEGIELDLDTINKIIYLESEFSEIMED